MAIEATDQSDTVRLNCWCGSSATVSVALPDVQTAIEGRPTDTYESCPAPNCEVHIHRDDLTAQSAHMLSNHPELIEERQTKLL